MHCVCSRRLLQDSRAPSLVQIISHEQNGYNSCVRAVRVRTCAHCACACAHACLRVCACACARRVCAGVQEISELFKDLATLTIEQGTVLDRIDGELETVLENTLRGTKELVAAEEIQKKRGRSVKCVAILMSIVTVEACLFIIKHFYYK